MKNGDFPVRYYRLPEDINKADNGQWHFGQSSHASPCENEHHCYFSRAWMAASMFWAICRQMVVYSSGNVLLT